MNYRMICNIIAKILSAEAVFMLPALLISLFSGESSSALAFALSILITLLAALILNIKKPDNRSIYTKEGLVTVGWAWLAVSLFGAFPFFLSGAIPDFVDCFFESVSGFTTTGATILSDIEVLPKGILYWRSFSHWLGGMGILVFMLAIASLTEKDGGESMFLLRAESPGVKISKLVPRMKTNASILYIIYIVLTIVQIIIMLPQLPLFDAVTIAFGTAGTGGFAIKNDSLASYSPYIQWVVTIFMLLFSVNFSMYFLLLHKQFRKVLKDEELRTFGLVVVVAIIILMINTAGYFECFGEALRHVSFTVASIISTSGFVTVDFDKWPQLSKTILLLLMFTGACAGSTGGGSKIVRSVILVKSAIRSVCEAVHPRSVKLVYMDGEVLDEKTVSSVCNYYMLYFLISAACMLLISLDGFSMETNLSAAITCISNVGPGMDAVGATMNFSVFSGFSKFVLSIVMLIGRLEIYPFLALLFPKK